MAGTFTNGLFFITSYLPNNAYEYTREPFDEIECLE